MTISIQMRQVQRYLQEAYRQQSYRGRSAQDSLAEVSYRWQDKQAWQFNQHHLQPQLAGIEQRDACHRRMNQLADQSVVAIEQAEQAASNVSLRMEDASVTESESSRRLREVDECLVRNHAQASELNDRMDRLKKTLVSVSV